MGVGVRIVSKNLAPPEAKLPKWRQETMTETLSVGKLVSARGGSGSSGRSSRRRRRRRAGVGAGGRGSYGT